MPKLQALTPLGSTQPRTTMFDGARVSENVDWALASVAARLNREDEAVAAAEAKLGMTLPASGGMTRSGPLNALWTGPGQWMVEAPMAWHEDLAVELKNALRDTCSVTDQSDGWVRFDLNGSRLMGVFERLFPLDVRLMESATVHRSLIDHMACFVICRKKETSFSVLGIRSSALSLHDALCSAAASVR